MVIQDRSKRNIIRSAWRDADGPPVLWNRVATVSGEKSHMDSGSSQSSARSFNWRQSPWYSVFTLLAAEATDLMGAALKHTSYPREGSRHRIEPSDQGTFHNLQVFHKTSRNCMLSPPAKDGKGYNFSLTMPHQPWTNWVWQPTKECPVKSEWSLKYFCIFCCSLVQRASKLVLHLSANFNMFSLAVRPSRAKNISWRASVRNGYSHIFPFCCKEKRMLL